MSLRKMAQRVRMMNYRGGGRGGGGRGGGEGGRSGGGGGGSGGVSFWRRFRI